MLLVKKQTCHQFLKSTLLHNIYIYFFFLQVLSFLIFILQIVQMCWEHRLYDAMIFVYNSGTNDFISPMEVRFSLLMVFNSSFFFFFSHSSNNLCTMCLLLLQKLFKSISAPIGSGKSLTGTVGTIYQCIRCSIQVILRIFLHVLSFLFQKK